MPGVRPLNDLLGRSRKVIGGGDSDLVTVDFPGVTGVKRQSAVVLSSETYHSLRPDVIVGLITTQTKILKVSDYTL